MITFNDLIYINDYFKDVSLERFDDNHDMLRYTMHNGRCCYYQFTPHENCTNCIKETSSDHGIKEKNLNKFNTIGSKITKVAYNFDYIKHLMECSSCYDKKFYIDDFMSINHRDYVIITDFNHHFSITNHLKQIDKNAHESDVVNQPKNSNNYLFIIVRYDEDSETYNTLKRKFKDKLVSFQKIFRTEIAYYGFEDDDTNMFKVMKMMKNNNSSSELVCLNPNRFNLDTVSVSTFLNNFKILSKFFPNVLYENYLDSGIIMY
ncbi:hypothetical protein PBI_SCTP2_288 [Salicola phage SCTP-2]|nr:hypothetical protein PBI_SCTP2_288 [Salicola phage SCTP-2]